MQRRRVSTLRLSRVLAISAVLIPGFAGAVAAPPPAHAGTPHPIGADFNGDGYADVAIG